MRSQQPVFGGIDAGGTTFKCGVADSAGVLLEKRRVPVTTPEETLSGCAAFFREASGRAGLQAIGIASFGPIDIDPASPACGTILKTPKPGWTGTDLRAFFAGAHDVPVTVDTDVNGALLAEMTRGAARGTSSAAYITVGTGIGAGIHARGGFAGSPLHPEFGHIPLRRHADDAGFVGTCPFHGDCLEGLASVTAVRARWGEPRDLASDHPGWPIIADYLAQACRTLTLTLRLQKIVLGGGLMLAPNLIRQVRFAYDRQMGDYLGAQGLAGADLIDTPALGDDAGLIGAVLLAMQADSISP